MSIQQTQVRPHILAYERDAIRTHALGDFAALLTSTAHQPAMLHYLDNAQNRVQLGGPLGPRASNENYGRELLELHTLGVDGGYSQQDVMEVARIFHRVDGSSTGKRR